MIQIYVAIDDLIPNPKEDLEWGKKAFGSDKIAKWDKSMRDNGFLKHKPLLVDWRGCIIDGNMRYYLAKKNNIKYVPIDYNFLVRDLNSFVHTLAYRWTDKAKGESGELIEIEHRLKEILPMLSKTEDRERRLLIKQIIEQIITKRRIKEKLSD